MAVWAVIGRELREESRRPLLYWLRLSVAVLGVGAFGLTALVATIEQAADEELGSVLFTALQAILFNVIWLVGPFMVADTLSREKREGTLGLLFLTPLRPGTVVAGKCLVHWCRALMLMLCFAPVLALPLLLGSVSGQQYLGVLLIDLAALACALSAGLVASAFAVRWSAAMVLAGVLAAIGLAIFALLYTEMLTLLTQGKTQRYFGSSYTAMISHGLFYLCVGGGTWITPGRVTAPTTSQWLAAHTSMALIGLLVAYTVPRVVAEALRRTLQKRGHSARSEAVQKVLTRPRFAQQWFRSKMRHALDRNPIGWLQQHRVSARITKWGWCLAVVLGEILILTRTNWYDLYRWQFWLGIALAVGLSISSASSFREERDNGGFELLLVTPLRERDLIWGRLRGLWFQFVPAYAVVIGLFGWWWLEVSQIDVTGTYVGRRWTRDEVPLAQMLLVLLVTAWLALPAIGLRASMVWKSFVGAWLATVAWGVLLPCILLIAPLPVFLTYGPSPTEVRWPSLLLAIAGAQLITAGGQLWLLHRKMARREFGRHAR